jgi:hypothetical protein
MKGNIEFFEEVIHTDKAEVPRLDDKNAAQFIMKMCSLGATVEFFFSTGLWIKAKTPIGEYTFIFDAGDDPDLMVEQVL